MNPDLKQHAAGLHRNTDIVQLGFVANLLLLTERRVNQLVNEGVLPRTERGHYELLPVVQAYIRYLRDRTLGGDMRANQVAHDKSRMIRARARLAELEVERMERRLLRCEDVANAWSLLVTNVRTRMLTIPSRVAPQYCHAISLAEANAALTTAIHDALEELSRIPVYEAE